MKSIQDQYKNFDRLLGEIINGVAAVAILGVSIILVVAFWGLIHF
jgi:hypothetical protein